MEIASPRLTFQVWRLLFAALLLGNVAGCMSSRSPPIAVTTPYIPPVLAPPAVQITTNAAVVWQAKVSSISYTGQGLGGEPTFDYWNDLNGNGIQDPGEPPGDTLITAPEFVSASGRNREGFFKIGTPMRIRAVIQVSGPQEIQSVKVSAGCAQFPHLNLRQVGPLKRLLNTNQWEGVFEFSDPPTVTDACEKFIWTWKIELNDARILEDQTRITGLYFLYG